MQAVCFVILDVLSSLISYFVLFVFAACLSLKLTLMINHCFDTVIQCFSHHKKKIKKITKRKSTKDFAFCAHNVKLQKICMLYSLSLVKQTESSFYLNVDKAFGAVHLSQEG